MSVARETAHLIGENPLLMGVLTLPPQDVARRDTAIVFLSSGLLHRPGPFRLHVDMARRLAQSGFVSLRLDQAGRGDSNRSQGMTTAETVRQEIQSVQQLLRAKAGTERLIVVGLCSGADDALEAASYCDAMIGLILLDGFAARTWRYYVTYYASRLFDPARLRIILGNRLARFRRKIESTSSGDTGQAELAVIRNFPDIDVAKDSFGSVFDRGGAALCVFTGGIKDYYCSDGQLRENLGLKKSDERLTELFYPDASHTYPFTVHRNELVRVTAEWCEQRFG